MRPFEDSRELSFLRTEFSAAAEELLAACRTRGAQMRPFFTVRGPGIQARLWCQSRSAEQIATQAGALRKAGAVWLAEFLDPKLAGRGPAVTNALPGLSWHQWGEAIDCFVVGEREEAVWNGKHPHYAIYAEEAKRLGLEAGALWKKLPDAVHVQWRKESSPLAAGYAWKEIDEEMRKRFAG